MQIKNYKGMKNMDSLLQRYSFLEKVKIIPTTQLFPVEPAWEKLKEGRCPICNSLLKKPRGKSISICYGKRHGDKKKFIIKNETLAKISK